MSISTESTTPQSVIIRIGNELDFGNAAEFRRVCNQRVHQGSRNFILDFSETNILDSTGLGAIFSLYREIAPLNGTVVFASLSEAVRIVVQVTRIYKVFPQFPSTQAAHNALA